MRDSRMQVWPVPWWNNGCVVIIWQYLAVIGWGCVWSVEFYEFIPKPNPIAVLLFIQNNLHDVKTMLTCTPIDVKLIILSVLQQIQTIKGCFIGVADIPFFFANNHTLYFPALPKQLSQHDLVRRASWFLSLFLTIACTFDVILLDITNAF